jgi:AcrR family transcriptional regulator
MPRTEEQFEEIRESRKTQIMHTALELFASEGYFTTSISKIADRAGISKGLMYNYFESKEDLILSIIGKGIDLLTEHFDRDRDGNLTEDEFEYMINESFRVLRENRDFLKLYFAIMLQPPVYKLVKEKYSSLVSGMLLVIRKYYERKGAEDPMAEALLLESALDGVSINYILNPDIFPIDAMKEIILKRFK